MKRENTDVTITFTIPDTKLQPERVKTVQHFIDEVRKKIDLFDNYQWTQKVVKWRDSTRE